MRFGKRSLAGVAAGALALGALTIASAPAASAKPSIKPKASVSATASAVRATGTSSSAISIAPAKLTWTGASSFANAPATPNGATLQLTTAPSAAAIMTIDDTTATDDTASLSYNSGVADIGVNFGNTATDDSKIFFNVDTAGSYAGRIYNGTDTVSFSFATAGAPTSMTLTPATQTVLVGGVGTVTVTLKDASGNTTQPQTVDNVTMSSSGDDTIAFTSLTGASGGKLQFGTFDDTIATQTAGTSTITATPAGTLPGSGVTVATASLVKSGTVSSTAVRNIAVTAPANAYNSWEPGISSTSWAGRVAQVPAATTSITLTVDDTTSAAAGNKIRIEVDANQGTVNGSTAAQYIDLTTDANKQATTTVTLGGLAVTNGTTVTVNQVNVANAQVEFSSQNVRLPISVLTPAVNGASTTVAPSALVTKIGNTTPVTVTVDDSFGTPQANYTVQVFRGAAASSTSGGTFLGQATTNASGVASLSVTNASTVTTQTTEYYYYAISGPGGSGAFIVAANDGGTSITYTTTGNITSMTVTPGSGTACSNTTCTPTAYGAVRIASAGIVSSTASTSTSAVSTGVLTAGNGSNMIELTIGTTPSNSSVVTVPAGMKVLDEAPTATTLWSDGAQSATVAGTAWLWATKTGTHDVVVTSGGLSVTVKVRAYNRASDAYNIAVTPATQSVAKGAIGTATLKVTDIFGNPVQTGTADDSGPVSITATGEILLAGYDTTKTYTTNASGESTVTIIAGNAAGAGTLTATPTTGTTTPAWVAGYTKPAGAPAPVTSAVATVAVGEGPVTKSITITGSRTTVSGKPGIEVDGITVGFEDGKTVIPYFRFPGETTYTEGTARPVITDDAFMWQRKPGKQFYAYVTSDDGAVQSNRVIIPAN
jgi:hypothetical protein